jgi:hypothetical protein
MSSRQEEKERRRKERLAAEQEQARRGANRQRLQWIGGGALVVIAIGVLIGVVVAGGGGDGDKGGPGEPGAAKAAASIPAQRDTDLQSSAAQAGCTVKTFPSEGRTHSPNPGDWKYKTNPPTSGTHNPTPAQDGVYPFGTQPSVGETVHSLEHGRIDIQYGPQVTRAQYAQLEAVVAEGENGYHQLLFRNQTRMPFAVAATAWTQQLGCKTFNPKIFDALRNFRERFRDQGPETVP